MASTPQQTAPTTATAVQIRTDFIERPPPAAGPADELPPESSVVIVPDMSAPLHPCQRPVTPAIRSIRTSRRSSAPESPNRYRATAPEGRREGSGTAEARLPDDYVLGTVGGPTRLAS